jgi:hypothetical protein
MKLLFENWRNYLNEDEEEAQKKEFLALLQQKRQERKKVLPEYLKEQDEVTVEPIDRELPVGQIYCDMDGVLADFAGGLLDLVHDELKNIELIKNMSVGFVGIAGKFEYMLKMLKAKLKNSKAGKQDPKEWDETQRLADQYIEETEGLNLWESLFENLPMLPAGAALWQLIGPYGVTILTGAPGGTGVLYAKVKWIERNLNPAPKHIIKQSDKRPYAAEESGKPNLLIDDWTHNLESWLNGGGIAVPFDETDSQSNLQAVSDILTGRG